jgi:hypothetical protein
LLFLTLFRQQPPESFYRENTKGQKHEIFKKSFERFIVFSLFRDFAWISDHRGEDAILWAITLEHPTNTPPHITIAMLETIAQIPNCPIGPLIFTLIPGGKVPCKPDVVECTAISWMIVQVIKIRPRNIINTPHIRSTTVVRYSTDCFSIFQLLLIKRLKK